MNMCINMPNVSYVRTGIYENHYAKGNILRLAIFRYDLFVLLWYLLCVFVLYLYIECIVAPFVRL